MAFRLRYLAQDLALPVGTFVIGRAPECELALDDPLVSRRHAELVVRDDKVTVADLGSRNGVIVEGERIEGEHELQSGDRLVIGSQSMVVYRSDEQAVVARLESRMAMQTLGGITIVRAADVHDFNLGGDDPPLEPTINTDLGMAIAGSRSLQSLRLLGGVAEKALALGRPDDAERVLSAMLGDILQKAESAPKPEQDVVDAAALLAARLAGATGKGSWIDWVMRAYTGLGRLAAGKVVDELHGAIRRVRSVDLSLMRAYVASMRRQQADLGAAERFVLQRLEGLAQLGALK